jgi:hypothetical protein
MMKSILTSYNRTPEALSSVVQAVVVSLEVRKPTERAA